MTGLVDLARRPLRWTREHPFAADTVLAAALAVLALGLHLASPDLETTRTTSDPTWWSPVLVVAAILPVMFRRRAPIASLLVMLGAQILCEWFYFAGSGWLGVLIGTYSVGAHTEGPRRTRGAIAVAAGTVGILVLGLVEHEIGLLDAISSFGLLTAAGVLGDNLRRRRANIADLADRAERAERERDLLARERVAEERARIARELHDIVAHSVSVMTIQATAARRNLETRPAQTATLLENIERTGRQTMHELRQVLGVLRNVTSGPEAMPLPTLADLPTLVEQSGGLPVRLAVTGLTDRVPAGVAVSVYRIVQEALTNANRHAGPGATVDVRVTCDPAEVQVVIVDDGRGASVQVTSESDEPSGHGYGLIGMQERAAAAGGTLRAGPRPGGGWRVVATLPYHATTSRPATTDSRAATSTLAS